VRGSILSAIILQILFILQILERFWSTRTMRIIVPCCVRFRTFSQAFIQQPTLIRILSWITVSSKISLKFLCIPRKERNGSTLKASNDCIIHLSNEPNWQSNIWNCLLDRIKQETLHFSTRSLKKDKGMETFIYSLETPINNGSAV